MISLYRMSLLERDNVELQARRGKRRRRVPEAQCVMDMICWV